MRKAMIFIGITWVGVVSTFVGMDDDRAALGLLAIMVVPATAAIIAFMIVEHRKIMGRPVQPVTHEQI